LKKLRTCKGLRKFCGEEEESQEFWLQGLRNSLLLWRRDFQKRERERERERASGCSAIV
jgi:hypothetical protein